MAETILEENSTLINEAQELAESLPDANTSTITGLSVGDIIEITAVDSNGTPTAWTKVTTQPTNRGK